MTLRTRWLTIAMTAGLLFGMVALVTAATSDEKWSTGRFAPKEALDQAKASGDTMRERLKHVDRLRKLAQNGKDIVKLNCLNDKYTQIMGHDALFQKAVAAIKAAIAINDSSAAGHEVLRIGIMEQKVLTLKIEADQCVGDDVTYYGNSTTTVDIDPDIPETDPTQSPLPGIDPIARPPEESPFGVGSNG